MGLLDKFKKAMTEPIGGHEKAPVRKKEPARKSTVAAPDEIVGMLAYVNLTEKNVKVQVTNEGDDGQCFNGGYVWEGENLIQVKQGETVLFEVTPRSKAYKELAPLARKKLRYVVIKEKTSDYGKYYRARLKYDATREEAFAGLNEQ